MIDRRELVKGLATVIAALNGILPIAPAAPPEEIETEDGDLVDLPLDGLRSADLRQSANIVEFVDGERLAAGVELGLDLRFEHPHPVGAHQHLMDRRRVRIDLRPFGIAAIVTGTIQEIIVGAPDHLGPYPIGGASLPPVQSEMLVSIRGVDAEFAT